VKLISIFKLDPSVMERPTDDEIARMGELIGEMRAAGVLIDTGGVEPGSLALNVRRKGDTYAVTDGPFTESKEIVGGYALFEVASRDEAIDWTKRFLNLAGDGECEIHQVSAP
jgi:hypothetical protein